MSKFARLLVVLASLTGLAQAPQFRLRTDLVQIDVTVLGADGRPERGLKREDFTLLEDGKVQEILGFAEVNIPDAHDSPLWARDAPPDVRRADDGRVLVFLLDDALTAADSQGKTRIEVVKRIAEEVIDQLGPTDVAAVVCTYDKRCVQDFTNDRRLLKAAVSRFTPKQFPAGYDWERQSAGVAASLAKYLSEQPGRRKAIIYVTPQQPMRPAFWPPTASSSDQGALARLSRAVTQQQMIRTFEQAMRSKVTVYGINSSGLMTLGSDHSQAGPDVGLDQSQPGAVFFGAAPRSLAAETGGFTIRNALEFRSGVAQIIRETGSYYLLGYEPEDRRNTTFNMLGGFRSIEVKVNRPELRVRTRTGYVPAKPAPVKNAEGTTSALAGILPKTDLPLQLSVAPFAVAGGRAAVMMVLGVTEPGPAQRTTDSLEVQFRAFTPRGDARGTSVEKIDVTIPSTSSSDVTFEVWGALDLRPGMYALRVSARSERMDKAGSVYSEVVVPDFEKEALSVSGAIVSAVPQLPMTRSNRPEFLLPVVPTTLREFTDRHRVSAYFRVYQRGRSRVVPATVRSHIMDARSNRVAESSATIESASFGIDRSADYRYLIPSTLTPGLYLLRFEVAAGASTVERSVRFTVR